ncbi:MAG: hypothetical protein EON90_06295 [Brevundimonas sp.]|nr:MAG: hypothetical protein EON90_06295 [Brevundimonas sp.]
MTSRVPLILILALVSAPATSTAAASNVVTRNAQNATPQNAPPQTTAAPPVCEVIVQELAEGEDRIRALQGQLQGSMQATEQNARAGQAIAKGSTALNWVTGAASLIPGVGFAASSAGAAATQQAIEANQRSTAATNHSTQSTVSELVPLSQRMYGLRRSAEAQGCALPPPPPM